MKTGMVIAALLLSPAAFAHEHGGKHAGSADECRTMAKGAEQQKCVTCVQQGGHHYHLGKKVKGSPCHDNANDPEAKKKS